jgi:hypothetical protein
MTDERPQAKKGISAEEDEEASAGEAGEEVTDKAAFFARSKPLSVAALKADCGIVP